MRVVRVKRHQRGKIIYRQEWKKEETRRTVFQRRRK